MRMHRPVITNHGVHCSCGVFCGSGRDPKIWASHAEDRFLLDPTTRLDTRPQNAIDVILDEMARIRENTGRVMNRLAESFNAFGRAVRAVDPDVSRLNRALTPPQNLTDRHKGERMGP